MRRLFALALLIASIPAATQTVIYVDTDATGMNTGTTWTDAYTEVQNALAAATSGDEIWVAEGLYVPTHNTDRSISFVLVDGISLYGGFNGTESSRDDRDWELHESILSGDIGIPTDSTDNSYHVVVANGVGQDTVLDGVTIQNGTARGGPAPDDRGAGVLALDGSPTIRNTQFLRNVIGPPIGDGERLGGGLYVENGSPVIEDCQFVDNSANGGGAAYFSNSDPLMRRIAMLDNTATAVTFVDGSAGTLEDIVVERGRIGASIREGSSPVFKRCTFRQTFHDTGDGGGISMDDSAPLFEDCLFEGNWASSGAGVDIGGGSTPLFLRTTFRENVATSSGGAVSIALSSPTFLDCAFDRNSGLGQGAILSLASAFTVIGGTFIGNYSTSSTGASGGVGFSGNLDPATSVLIANSVFAGNEGASGGALLASGVNPGEARIVNSTFVGNVARTAGGSIYSFFAPGLELNNVILWGNEAPNDPEIHVAEGGPPVVERAIVEGGCPSGTMILDADPKFVRNPDPGPDGQWGTDDDDYGDLRVLETSPAIDFGLTSFLPADIWDLDGDGNTTEPLPIDLNGDMRVQGGSVDLGAYEGPGVVANEHGVPEPSETVLRVYPNPADAFVIVRTSADAVTIVDVLGRQVLTATRDDRETFIDIATLPQGVHVVRAGSQSQVVTVRR